MFKLENVKGIIFDYGGTIDSNGKHWAEVLWESYADQQIPITKEQFREAYVYTERYLATNPVIMPNHNFLKLLEEKVKLQINYLCDNNYLTRNNKISLYYAAVSNQCYTFVSNLINQERLILKQLKEKYPMILVSNFYGNIEAVLEDFELLDLFDSIIESAVVGVRKPDTAIFKLGVDKLALMPENIVVIGDSYTKDIVPAMKNGCQTIWLKGLGWDKDDENATADVVISDFMELKSIFQI